MYSVVIVDDEKWVVRSLRSTLTAIEQIEVVGEASDGAAGLDMIRSMKPDFAFVDVRMPVMGGLEMLQAAGQEELSTLFIVISGHAEFAYAQKAIFHNAIGYCLKPFSRSEIAECLQKGMNLLNKREAQRQTAPAEAVPVQPAAAQPTLQLTKNELVNTMLGYINTHYSEDLSIQALADLFPINANYASQLFSRHVGETFSAYLTRVRIEKAAALLLSTELPIAEVSAMVGYRDYLYFTKVFKKSIGCTPSQYQRSAGGVLDGKKDGL